MIIDHQRRRDVGLASYEQILGVAAPTPTSPRAAALVDFVFAEIWTHPGLTRRERRLIVLSCLAGADALGPLADHLYGALKSGVWTPPTPTSPDQEQRKQRGEQEFRVVNCAPAPPRGVPYYDDGILNFVLGEMWQRPGLSRRDRRWVTLGCVGLNDTVLPGRSHVYSAMKTGDCSYAEMRELVLQFAAYSGWPKASFLQQAVDEEHARIEAAEGRAAPPQA